MNERILALVKQADPEFGNDANDMPDAIVGIPAIERFVELIVAECIRVPYNMWDKTELNADLAVKIEHRIKEHFGVEE